MAINFFDCVWKCVVCVLVLCCTYVSVGAGFEDVFTCHLTLIMLAVSTYMCGKRR